MGKNHQDSSKRAKHWIELKAAWEKWQQGQPMPTLSTEAQKYFEALSFVFFNEQLDQRGSFFENVPRMRTAIEAWSQVFHYLVAKRPRARLHVLDDIFLQARNKAQATPGISNWDALEQQVGWIVKQFGMRVRDAVRAYAREHGTTGLQSSTQALDKPLDAAADEAGERTLLDLLASADHDGSSEVERRELQALAHGIAAGYFTGLRAAFKLSIFLRTMRCRRSIAISVEEPVVEAVAGIKRNTFAQGAVDSLKGLAAHLAAQPACEELDKAGRHHFCVQATISLLDRTEVWIWLGACVTEIIKSNAELGAGRKIMPTEMLLRLQAFAELLHERLRESGALLSENETAPFFNAIATARLQHGL
jgi:hypothetical protein